MENRGNDGRGLCSLCCLGRDSQESWDSSWDSSVSLWRFRTYGVRSDLFSKRKGPCTAMYCRSNFRQSVGCRLNDLDGYKFRYCALAESIWIHLNPSESIWIHLNPSESLVLFHLWLPFFTCHNKSSIQSVGMFFLTFFAAVNCEPHDHWSRFSAGSAAGMVLYQALVPLQIAFVQGCRSRIRWVNWKWILRSASPGESCWPYPLVN
jgi:hypothetical protein